MSENLEKSVQISDDDGFSMEQRSKIVNFSLNFKFIFFPLIPMPSFPGFY